MKKVTLILSVAMLALLAQSCSLFSPSEKTEETNQLPPSAESQPSPDSQLPAGNPPIVAQNPIPVASLIPSTNSDQRRQEITSGRSDPFAIVAVAPIIRILPSLEKSQSSQAKPVASSSKTASTPLSPSFIRPQKALPPALPVPTEAKGVLVSGIVELNGGSVAIVKSPSEAVARQVTAGSTLANGQVRVKAIYANSDIPFVILEQYGIEVPRAVGQAAEVPVDTAATSLAIPQASQALQIN